MKLAMTTMAAVLTLLLAGCVQHGGADVERSAGAEASIQADAGKAKEPGMNNLKPPSPDSVLYVIYQRDGDGAVSYKIDGGAVVSYWYGYTFDLDGRHYFTGFATSTEGEEGVGTESAMMEPGKVAIAQATFVQGEEAGMPKWLQVDADGYVGEFGSNDQADAVDDSRQPQAQGIADGRLLLAVPTRRFDDGIANMRYALFLFDPANADDLSFRKWGYLGSVGAGSDNAAACEDGKVLPCAASVGALAFEAPGQSGIPDLKITFTGWEISGPGNVRDLRAEDSLSYSFDAKEGRYLP